MRVSLPNPLFLGKKYELCSRRKLTLSRRCNSKQVNTNQTTAHSCAAWLFPSTSERQTPKLSFTHRTAESDQTTSVHKSNSLSLLLKHFLWTCFLIFNGLVQTVHFHRTQKYSEALKSKRQVTGVSFFPYSCKYSALILLKIVLVFFLRLCFM